jgi:hypothetical protein
MLLILSFSVRHSLSNYAIEDLLMLLSVLLPSGASVDMLKSYYKFEQHLPKSDNNNRYVFYCANEVCRSIVATDDSLAGIISFVVDPMTNKMCILCRFYKKSGVQLLTHSVPVASHFFVVSLSDTLKAVEPREIFSKIVFVGIVGNTDTYFTALQPNKIECD